MLIYVYIIPSKINIVLFGTGDLSIHLRNTIGVWDPCAIPHQSSILVSKVDVTGRH